MLALAFASLLACSTPGTYSAPAQSVGTPTAPSPLPKFVITLALGDVEPGPAGTFTPEATRALSDMKGFLPYKRYTPLDTVYLIGLGGPVEKLRGVDGNHQLLIRGTRLSPTSIKVDSLRLTGVWPVPPEMKDRYRSVLIDTSFMIADGETVVVGTSRLDGNRALILLVTAVK